MSQTVSSDVLKHIDTAVASLAICNKLLLLFAFGFASLALVLAGFCGYYFGKNKAAQEQHLKGEVVAKGLFKSQKDTVAISQVDDKACLPLASGAHTGNLDGHDDPQRVSRQSHRASTNTTLQADLVANPEVLEALVKRDSERWKMQYVHDDLKPAYAKYVSQWVESDLPWGAPASVHPSELGSRHSLKSGISGALTMASEDNWRGSTFHGRDSNQSTLSAHLLYSDWNISPNQLRFSYDLNGALVVLNCRYGHRIDLCGRSTETYKAVLDDKIDVAVKVMKIPRGELPEQTVSSLAAQLLTMNSCQQIVHFWGICQTDEQVMIVTEYLEGGCIREAIKRNPVGVQWYNAGKSIARSVAQGLAALHSQHMAHKDLKSRRVLVQSKDNTAKLCGVNIDKITRHLKIPRDRRLASSFEWTSPEVLFGQRPGPASDMFAFGVVLWELVTHELPIRGTLREVRVPQECPSEIKQLMLDCIGNEPRDRPSATQAVEIIQSVWNLPGDKLAVDPVIRNGENLHLRREGRPPPSRSPVPGMQRRSGTASLNGRPGFSRGPSPLGIASKAERAAALRSLKSAPAKDRKSRDRIEAGLRAGFENVYAQNRMKSLTSTISANGRFGPPARYMSRDSSRSPSPEPSYAQHLSPTLSDMSPPPSDSENQMIGNSVTDAETQVQQEAVLKRLTEIADQQSNSDCLPCSSLASKEGQDGRLSSELASTSTEASFAPTVPIVLDPSPDTPHFTSHPTLSDLQLQDSDKLDKQASIDTSAAGSGLNICRSLASSSGSKQSLGNSEASFREIFMKPFRKAEKVSTVDS